MLAHEIVVESHSQVKPLLEGFRGGAPKKDKGGINLQTLSNPGSAN